METWTESRWNQNHMKNVLWPHTVKTHFESILQCKIEEKQEDKEQEEHILAEEHGILINHTNLQR